MHHPQVVRLSLSQQDCLILYSVHEPRATVLCSWGKLGFHGRHGDLERWPSHHCCYVWRIFWSCSVSHHVGAHDPTQDTTD